MPATHRNSPMTCFLPTEDLISVELKTKQSGIWTKTTPATVDLQVTMVCPIPTSRPTLWCNPSHPPGSYSSSITSGSWKHQPYNMWSLCADCRLQAGRPCAQCSAVVSVPVQSMIFAAASRHYLQTIKTTQASPGQPGLRMSLRLKCSSDICCNLFRRQQDLQMIFLILLVQYNMAFVSKIHS